MDTPGGVNICAIVTSWPESEDGPRRPETERDRWSAGMPVDWYARVRATRLLRDPGGALGPWPTIAQKPPTPSGGGGGQRPKRRLCTYNRPQISFNKCYFPERPSAIVVGWVGPLGTLVCRSVAANMQESQYGTRCSVHRESDTNDFFLSQPGCPSEKEWLGGRSQPPSPWTVHMYDCTFGMRFARALPR